MASITDVLSFSETRAHLKKVMDRVVDDRTPILITRRRGKPVVMVSLEDWTAMDATAHLLASPVNAARLRDSIAELDSGRAEEHELIRRP